MFRVKGGTEIKRGKNSIRNGLGRRDVSTRKKIPWKSNNISVLVYRFNLFRDVTFCVVGKKLSYQNVLISYKLDRLLNL